MNYENQKQIAIIDFLSRIGVTIAQKGNEAWCKSPFNPNENTASFKVDISKNAWYDHASGKGGNLFELVKQLYGLDFKGSQQKISEIFSGAEIVLPPAPANPRPNTTDDRKIEVVDFKAYRDFVTASEKKKRRKVLVEYAESRGISIKTLCAIGAGQIKYLVNGQGMNGTSNPYFAIGFPNHKGGYEIRNAFAKRSTSPKSTSYFRGKTNSIAVFEGFFDLASAVEYYGHFPNSHVLVLNSLSFLNTAYLKGMEKFDSISLFLDNNPAGDRYTKLVMDHFAELHTSVEDYRQLYEGFDDFNAFWKTQQGKAYSVMPEKMQNDPAKSLFKTVVTYVRNPKGQIEDSTTWYYSKDYRGERSNPPKGDETFDQLMENYQGLRDQVNLINKGMKSGKIKRALVILNLVPEPSDPYGRLGKRLIELVPGQAVQSAPETA